MLKFLIAWLLYQILNKRVIFEGACAICTFNTLTPSAFHADNPVVFFDITAGDGRQAAWMRDA